MEREIIATMYKPYTQLLDVAWCYNPNTNQVWIPGCEEYKTPYNSEFFFVQWKDPNNYVQVAIPKKYINIYRSDCKEPEDGFVLIEYELDNALPFYFKNKDYLDWSGLKCKMY